MDKPSCKDVFEHAWQVQEDAAQLGFDWPDVFGVLDKIEEEVGELREALQHKDTAHAQDELGDIFLATINAARFLSVQPATVLSNATQRFESRFDYVKARVEAGEKDWKDYSLDELEAVWQAGKKVLEKKGEKRVDTGA